MALDTEHLAARLAGYLLTSLGTESAEVRTLALTEANKLADALARIAALLLQGQINRDEAAALVKVQTNASEAVLASLAEFSRIAARRAVNLGLKDVIDLVDEFVGKPLLGDMLQI